MQSTAGQRALSTLASKLHPQLPLTPRESQQLLTLLTSSFRTHLDREHPISVPEKDQSSVVCKTINHDHHESSRARSSYALATQHIDAVLTNPLFAVKHSSRGSELAASDVLRDPMAWFLTQIATGTATLSKASLCLEMLDKRTTGQTLPLHQGKTPGALISDWLRSSGLDTSKEFLDMCVAQPKTQQSANTFISRLVSLLVADGKKTLVWSWIRRPLQSDLDRQKNLLFKKHLLKHMVQAEASRDLYRGISSFRRACEIIEQTDRSYEILRPAGQYLVQAIMSRPTDTIDPALYNSFRHTTRLWITGGWAHAVTSMLSLHHPTSASALPGLRFIQDPAGAAKYANAMPSQRRFIVQLSLGVAHQLLEEENYKDAQAVMAFAKQYLQDLVLSNLPAEQQPVADRLSRKIERERRREERNLELLDGLVPT